MDNFTFPINPSQDKERLAYAISALYSSGKTYREISQLLSLPLSTTYYYAGLPAAQPSTNTAGPHISLILSEDIGAAAPVETAPAEPQSILWYPPKKFDWALIAPNDPLDREENYYNYIDDWYFRNIICKEPHNFLEFWFKIRMTYEDKISQETFSKLEDNYNMYWAKATNSKSLFKERNYQTPQYGRDVTAKNCLIYPFSSLVKFGLIIAEKEYAFYEKYFDVDKWEDGAPWPPLRADKIKEL